MKKRIFACYFLVLCLLFVELMGLIIYCTIGDKYSENLEKVESKIEEREPVLEVPIIEKSSLFMVGDVLIHGAVYADADMGNGYDFTPMLEEFEEIVASHDLSFYNQESILGGSQLGVSSYPRFNSPDEVGDAFREVGFNLVSLANNHTLDKGEQAILNSKHYWDSHHIYTAGSYSSWNDRNTIRIKEVNGIRYVMFAYTDHTNGLLVPSGKEYLVDVYSEAKVKADVETVRDQVDVVLVSMHWGDEYSHSVSNRQRQIASQLASLGVDIIIGHHPHVVEPIEYLGDTLVIYSLGNFLSAQRGVEKLTGLMVSLDIVKTTYQGVVDISLNNIKVGLTYTQ
ncbi:MAG: CapA family protein [bacterium]|nr:CapA family protein [bacterium]